MTAKPDVGELARQAVGGRRFVIPADEVVALHAAAGCSMDALLVALCAAAAQMARPVLSHFHVGAAALGVSGAVYLGVNLEFRDSSLSQSVHGEQCLVSNLVAHGERSVMTIAVNAAPCGHCRQFLSELACADTVRLLFGYQGHREPEVFTLGQLLPARFGPLDLLEDASVPLLLEQQSHALSWAPAAQAALQQRAGDEQFQRAAAAALAAAQDVSYAPYSHCPSAVALVTSAGVAAGGYLESAAHNPGLHPFQAAMAAAVMQGCLEGYEQIQEVVLVERQDGMLQHARVTAAVAGSVREAARVTVLHVLMQQ